MCDNGVMQASGETTPSHLNLRFGPYETPAFEYGDIVFDERFGDVKILGMADARLHWPTGKPLNRKRGLPSVILYGDLVEAVKRESRQTLMHWWGVGASTAQAWRRALEVDRTEGDRLRSVEIGHAAYPIARPAMLAKSRDPVRRQKIADSKRGKKRPRHVIEAMRNANTGRTPTGEARQKMSQSHKRRGTRPPKAGIPWTEAEDELIHNLSPPEAVLRLDRTLTAIWSRRRELGLTDGRKTAAAGRQAALYAHCLEIIPELLTMRAMGQSIQKLTDWLNAHGIENKRRSEWNRGQVDTMLRWYREVHL